MRKTNSVSSQKNQTTPTIEEIIREIRKSETITADGFTTLELAKSCEHGLPWSRQIIRKLIENGRCRRIGFRTIQGIDGKAYRTPTFEIINA